MRWKPPGQARCSDGVEDGMEAVTESAEGKDEEAGYVSGDFRTHG
jgi:hypothetical protein